MVGLAGSSLCDADEDVVYRMRVCPGRDEVLKVGELTDTGTDSLHVGSELVKQQSRIQDRIIGVNCCNELSI